MKTAAADHRENNIVASIEKEHSSNVDDVDNDADNDTEEEGRRDMQDVQVKTDSSSRYSIYSRNMI